jgi:DNA-binding CsgD family transcriptional regulator
VARAAALAREGLVLVRQTGTRLDIARLLLNLGLMAVVQQDLERAESISQKALSLFREEGDRWGEADTFIRLGRVAFERDDMDQAAAFLGASLSLFQDVGDPEGTAVALVHLGWVRRRQGEQPPAARHFAEGLALCRVHQHPSCIAWALLGDGAMALDRNDARAAGAMWDECLRIATALDDRLIIATVLEWSAHVSSPGTSRIAAQMLGAASALRDGLGLPLGAPLVAEHEHIMEDLRSQLGEASYNAAFEAGRSLPPDEATALGMDLLASAPSGPASSTAAQAASLVLSLDRPLTPRELQVLRLIAEGMPDREIANALFISRRTVSHHVSVILSKLGVTSRVGAATYALRAGLV